MASLLFYSRPVPVNRYKHRQARVRTVTGDFSFAAATNSVLLAGVEWIEAAKEYPIVFSKIGEERFVPVALLGLRNQENLFVGLDGSWNARYVPAFVRCYPFVLARGGEEGGHTLCIDESYEGFTAAGASGDGGERLFEEDGSNSAVLQRAVDFLGEYQRQYARVEPFTARLAELDLFTELTARIELRAGGTFSLGGLQVVDEKRLLDLTGDTALQLFRRGELAWIYAHLASLTNMNRLVNRLAERRQADAPAQ